MKKFTSLFVGIAIVLMIAAYCGESRADVSDPVNHSQNNGEAKVMFGLLAATAFYATEKGYEVSPHLSIGKTVAQSDHTIGNIGVLIDNKWDFELGLLGEGYTKNGNQKSTYFGGISRRINPNWHFLGGRFVSRIGVAYLPNAQLVGESNYRLGFILDYKTFELEWGHYSSGGLWEENAGIDFLLLSMRF